MKLDDMVKVSKIMSPSLYKPSYLFIEMLNDKKQSFKDDVEVGNLQELVDNICFRAYETENQFEHLQMSISKLHKNYLSHTKSTLVLL